MITIESSKDAREWLDQLIELSDNKKRVAAAKQLREVKYYEKWHISKVRAMVEAEYECIVETTVIKVCGVALNVN